MTPVFFSFFRFLAFFLTSTFFFGAHVQSHQVRTHFLSTPSKQKCDLSLYVPSSPPPLTCYFLFCR